MKESVAAVFIFENEVFTVKRQDYLRVFPGYTAFPGGKVDSADIEEENTEKDKLYRQVFPTLESYKLVALEREIKEELNFDLFDAFEKKLIKRSQFLGVATSPSFNPYRFNTHFILFELSQKIDFEVDEGECLWGKWQKVSEILLEYNNAQRLIVPPLLRILNHLNKTKNSTSSFELNTIFDEDKEVFMIESIKGVKQFFPLSKTFPPANRTNCFLIGDEGHRQILVDPSPQDENELEKLLKTTLKFGFNAIFITHHHPDHHLFAEVIARKFNIPLLISTDSYTRLVRKHGKDHFKAIDLEFINDGQYITQSLGEKVHAFSVPGHDEGQLSLAPETMNWYIVGDLIQTIGTVVIGGDEGNMGKYYKTLETIIELDPTVIFPSHGIALGGTFKLRKTLKHRKMREKHILELLEKKYDRKQILGLIYFGLDERLHKYALAVIDAHIYNLKFEGFIKGSVAKNVKRQKPPFLPG